ncbi:MAG: hypothetical protein J5647_06360 [Spirochaetaceae bacterium]|nr:hypothetical protein [Spirochaetaceae bacterium]
MEQSNEAELYLFLSVDIIDSTKKKYNQDGYNQDWTQCFYSFFKEFPEIFNALLVGSASSIKQKDCSFDKDIVINPWKYAGDEILFYICINQKRQVPCIVRAFKQALIEWKNQQDKKKNGSKLGKTEIKGCIWTGQFPFIDKRFTYYEESERIVKTDFIGPSIDCGFRLGKYASDRGIIISIEVMDFCRQDSDLYNSFFFYKSETLKGVGNMEYPIFNLLLDDKYRNTIEKHIIQSTQSQLESFLNSYYEENERLYKGRVSRINKNTDEHLNDYLSKKLKEWEGDVKKTPSLSISDKENLLKPQVKNQANEQLQSFVKEAVNNLT